MSSRLNREKLLTASVEDIGAYLKYTKSQLKRSSEILFVEIFSPVIILNISDNCWNSSFFLNKIPFKLTLNIFNCFNWISPEKKNTKIKTEIKGFSFQRGEGSEAILYILKGSMTQKRFRITELWQKCIAIIIIIIIAMTIQ